MQLIKSINIIILYLALSIFFIIVFSNYSSGDFFWTPLRSIYIFKTNNLLEIGTLKHLLISTKHNDSIKLFPTVIEIISLKFTGNWRPRISLLIGLGSWLSIFYLYYKLFLRSFNLSFKYQKISALILFLCFIGPPFFFYRFTIVFALFKTLPLICLILSAQILFKKDSNINNLELILLFTFCFVAQFSYSWGSILWITTYLVLFFNYLVLRRKYLNLTKIITFGFLGTFSTTLYISILDFSTINSLFFTNNISASFKNLSQSIKGFYSFLSTYSLSYLGGLDRYSQKFPTCLFDTDISNIPQCRVDQIYIKIIVIIFSLFIFFLVMQIIQIIKKGTFLQFIFQSGPYLFVALNTSTIPVANLFLRSQNISPPRYFSESTLFSISLFLIALISFRFNKFSIFKLFIFFLIFLSTIINFSNINIYTFKLLNKEPLGDPHFSNAIECIQNTPEHKKNYDYLFNQCEFWKINKYFDEQSEFNHPFIKIKNIDVYTKKVFKVLGQ